MDNPVRRHIVISAVNLRKGGTLTVLRDCLGYLCTRQDLQVTAIVHRQSLCDYPGIDYIEIPWSIKGWFRRLWCEYVTLHRLSRKIGKTDLWFSLHDTTPRVEARRQAVYCHTPFPFMKARLRDFRMDYKIALFTYLTKFAYKWNVKKNSFLVVQQTWMREALSKLVNYPQERIIVAPPSFKPLEIPASTPDYPPVFLYPATADVHKDFETLCEAARILETRMGKGRFKVVITVKGDENRYARWLRAGWGDVASLEFRGLLSREELARAYGKATCLVFPSRSETWGLPISEFLPTGKPMLVGDLPYAHETAVGASQVAFFPIMNPEALAETIAQFLSGSTEAFQSVPSTKISPPYADSWEQLFHILLDDN